jgi:hypothetical protein
MSVSGISSSTNTYQDPASQIKSVRQDFSGLTTSLASGDLAASQTAFATLMQDIGNSGAQNTTATSSTNTQSATNGGSNVTSSLVDAFQATNGVSQNGSDSSATTLFRALSLYAHVGQLNLNLPTTGLLSAIG